MRKVVHVWEQGVNWKSQYLPLNITENIELF